MAILKYFIMCDNVTETEGKMSFNGVFDKINAINLPTQHDQCVMVLGFVNGLGQYNPQVKIVAPDGQIVLSTDNKLKVSLEDRTHIANLIIQLEGLPLHTSGVYWVIITLDSTEIARYPFIVELTDIDINLTREEILSDLVARNLQNAALEIECPNCHHSTMFIMTEDDQKVDAILLPDSNEFLCPNCNNYTFDLKPAKRQFLHSLKIEGNPKG